MSVLPEKLGHVSDSKVEYFDASLEKSNTTRNDSNELDHELDKRITRKFDTHVVPWLFGLWLLAFIDRRQVH